MDERRAQAILKSADDGRRGNEQHEGEHDADDAVDQRGVVLRRRGPYGRVNDDVFEVPTQSQHHHDRANVDQHSDPRADVAAPCVHA